MEEGEEAQFKGQFSTPQDMIYKQKAEEEAKGGSYGFPVIQMGIFLHNKLIVSKQERCKQK